LIQFQQELVQIQISFGQLLQSSETSTTPFQQNPEHSQTSCLQLLHVSPGSIILFQQTHGFSQSEIHNSFRSVEQLLHFSFSSNS